MNAVEEGDVSPHNLFLTFDGQVKVLDFGIAKAATQESNTRTGVIKGKFAYIAPEQARGERVDCRADVWSMGVTMWEVLSGKRLFRRPSEVAVLQATLSEPIPFLTEVVPTLPRELAEICDRALQRDPERRWPSAAAMKGEIDEWIAAASKTSSRVTLSAYLKETFAADMSEQRSRIRACLEQVNQTGSFGALTASSMLELPSLTAGTDTRVEGRSGSRSGATPPPNAAKPEGLRAAAPNSTLDTHATGASDRRALYAAAGAVLLLAVGGSASWLGSVERSGPTSSAPGSGEPFGTVPLPLEPAPAVAPPVGVAPAVEGAAASAPEEPVAPAAAEVESDPAAVAPVTEPRPNEPTRRRTSRGGEAATEAAATPEPAPGPEPAPPGPADVPPPGRLHLDCAPYAVVSFEGRRLGITPIDVELPAGSHTLTLRNPEAGIETTYRVTVRSGETTSRTVALE